MPTWRYSRFLSLDGYDALVAELGQFPQVEVKMLTEFGPAWTAKVVVSTSDAALTARLKLKGHPF